MERGGIELISQADHHSDLTPLDCALYVGNEALARMLAEMLGSGDDSTASELLEQARRRVVEPQATHHWRSFAGCPGTSSSARTLACSSSVHSVHCGPRTAARWGARATTRSRSSALIRHHSMGLQRLVLSECAGLLSTVWATSL